MSSLKSLTLILFLAYINRAEAYTNAELGVFLGFVFAILLTIAIILFCIMRKKFGVPQKKPEMLISLEEKD
ncbi:unnamed protein product [Blepharisma stoltei]|uniref:Uncharacterized protein n=1 Tax=Blepharisma stoltei TaxID=1481888 RepID=A0AAU9I7W1_9CILI|nr:unnamed protein product [Blepharisma stoltei]